jgi:hypothetical protein
MEDKMEETPDWLIASDNKIMKTLSKEDDNEMQFMESNGCNVHYDNGRQHGAGG